jgi:hypothetical protein
MKKKPVRRAVTEQQRRRAGEEQDLDTLLAELMRIRESDPPMNDGAIRRIRHEGRP